MKENRLYNRLSKQYVDEDVPGGFFIHFLYNSLYAKNLILPLIVRKFVSSIAGWYYDLKPSARGIEKFIQKYKIDMSRYESDSHSFATFNEFFTRKIKLEHLEVDRDPNCLYSPCDGKIRVFENIDCDSIVQFKSLRYSLSDLLGSRELAGDYEGGTLCVIRLSPTDYHRFHHFDEGSISSLKLINGKYYSVNNTALEAIEDLYIKNKRYVSIFDSANFGKVCLVDVAATCVGSICYNDCEPRFMAERGLFKFGGSTVILILKKDAVRFDNDILEQSLLNNECVISVGEKIGEKVGL